MLTGKAPFRGSPAEVIYQHQQAPLPVEQLKGVPQPIVTLLEVLLEKDPVRRFQTPAELSKVMPMVKDAIDAGSRLMKTIRGSVSSTGDVKEEWRLADRVRIGAANVLRMIGNKRSYESTPERVVQRFEHYELVKNEDGTPVELGRGSMGVTYKAFDVDLRCPVTLKVISERYVGDESTRLRFLRQARAAAKVRHANVASVFHLGRTGRSYFYAMEFVEGETLQKLIKRSGRLEVKPALEVTTQVAAGLSAVHEQNLVHRDIKPSNIMVKLKEGGAVTAKIIDLGLAKPARDAPADAAISLPGAFAGTPEFASPEQFVGVGVDIRSDLYSLGVTLWEMLTGKTPFRGTPGEVMHQHQHGPLPFEQLKELPQPVFVLLEVLLEKDPAQRFQNPADLLKVIPTITGAIDVGRRIARQSLQKTPFTASRVRTRKPPTRIAPKKISVARLPVTGGDVFGREEDIAFLDSAWANKDVNVVTIVAWAGVGKSTLVNHWLRRMAAEQYRSAQLVFGWSFYRQGTSGGPSSADEFLDAALSWFGDLDPRIGTAWEKGERLAKLVAHRPHLVNSGRLGAPPKSAGSAGRPPARAVPTGPSARACRLQ